jgi:hypothetical protein
MGREVPVLIQVIERVIYGLHGKVTPKKKEKE